MSLIIPYKGKELYDKEVAFIKPNGEIIYTYGEHERYASEYCYGTSYRPTKLTKEQQELFELWLDQYEFSKHNLYSDFLVYLLSFDKVETVLRESITTTNCKPLYKIFQLLYNGLAYS